MKSFLLSICLWGAASVMAHSDKFQEFLTQSGTQLRYDCLTLEEQEELEQFWLRIEQECTKAKSAFDQLVRDEPESMEILKNLFNDASAITLQLALAIENKPAEVDEAEQE